MEGKKLNFEADKQLSFEPVLTLASTAIATFS